MAQPVHILVDADACPVKAEIFRVASRYDLPVTLVANAPMRLPREGRVELVRVPNDPDAADDWLAEHADASTILVTADVPLAARAVERGATVLSPSGRVFDAANIGDQLATRNLLSDIRDAGGVTSGPPPFSARDRSTFLQRLDEAVHRVRRRA